ncbi:MAG: gliding motility lipoprotein GldH [Bacteroidetes bacterium]|nr:gliding motility lipoprotein GldH [Bacteroidota bacterium]
MRLLYSSLKICVIYFSLIVFTGCHSFNAYEYTTPFPKHNWPTSEKVTAHFINTDTAAFYNIFAVIRHTGAYHFNNIWVNISTKAPADTTTSQQLNLKLANNSQGWLGTYFDDIIEHRIQINPFPVKLKEGEYTFTLQQIMREDPLQEMMNAGIRIEKNIQ